MCRSVSPRRPCGFFGCDLGLALAMFDPVFRFLARTVFSTSATMEALLRDLAAHLGVTTQIEPAEPSQLAARR